MVCENPVGISMKTFIVISTVLSMSLFSSCSDSGSAVSRSPEMAGVMSNDYEEMSTAPAYAPSPDIESYSRISADSRVQINGNLSLEVQNVSAAMEKTRTLVNQYGGSITSSDLGDSFSRYANISILIPQESFSDH